MLFWSRVGQFVFIISSYSKPGSLGKSPEDMRESFLKIWLWSGIYSLSIFPKYVNCSVMYVGHAWVIFSIIFPGVGHIRLETHLWQINLPQMGSDNPFQANPSPYRVKSKGLGGLFQGCSGKQKHADNITQNLPNKWAYEKCPKHIDHFTTTSPLQAS